MTGHHRLNTIVLMKGKERVGNSRSSWLRCCAISALLAAMPLSHNLQAAELPPLLDTPAASPSSPAGMPLPPAPSVPSANAVDELFSDVPPLPSAANNTMNTMAAPSASPVPPLPSAAPVSSQELASPLPPQPQGDLTLPLPPTPQQQLEQAFQPAQPTTPAATSSVTTQEPAAREVVGTRPARQAKASGRAGRHASRYQQRRSPIMQNQREAMAVRGGYQDAKDVPVHGNTGVYPLQNPYLNVQSGAAYPELQAGDRSNAHLPPVADTAQNYSEFFSAIARGDQKGVIAYLSHYGMNPNARNEWGDTPVMHAVRYGQLDVLRLLLARGATTDGLNVQGMTALHMAVLTGLPQLVEALLQAGARTDVADAGYSTPFMLANQRGDQQMMQLLSRYQPVTMGGGAALQPMMEEPPLGDEHQQLMADAAEEMQHLTAELPEGLIAAEATAETEPQLGRDFIPAPRFKPGVQATLTAHVEETLSDDPDDIAATFLSRRDEQQASPLAMGSAASSSDPAVLAAIQSHYLKQGERLPDIQLPQPAQATASPLSAVTLQGATVPTMMQPTMIMLPTQGGMATLASPQAAMPAAANAETPATVTGQLVVTAPRAVPASGIWVSPAKKASAATRHTSEEAPAPVEPPLALPVATPGK